MHPVDIRSREDSVSKYHHDLDLDSDNSAALILRAVPRGSRVLEFGPSTGYMTEYLRDELGCTVWGVELDADAAAIAARWCERMIVANLEDLEAWLPQLAGELFDVVIFADVLEHLRTPQDVLDAAVQHLSPDGIVLTSIPNFAHNSVLIELLNDRFGYRSLGLLDDTHVRCFTRETVVTMLAQAGLAPVEWLDTRAHPSSTEFGVGYDDLPQAVAQFLGGRPDGDVYQFVTLSRRAVEAAAPPPAERRAGPAYDYPVSIIVPLFNQCEYTAACLGSIAEHTPEHLYEIVLVDNGSTDGTAELLEQLGGDVTIIRNEQNLGFSAACNQGAAAARGRYLLFLNNDTVAQEGWLEPLIGVLEESPDVGMVGSQLLFPDGSVQHAGVIVVEDRIKGVRIAPIHALYRSAADSPLVTVRRDVSAVTGACMLVRRETFFPFGGFDEEYWNGYEDMELCFQVRAAGWRIIYEPASCLYHCESVSGPERFRRQQPNIDRLNARWAGLIATEVIFEVDGTHRMRGTRSGISEFLGAPGAARAAAA